jgi:hypothetical protein
MKNINGSFHCGKVSWNALSPIKTVVKCHCQNFRKLQGGDYSNWVVLAKEQFEISTDKEIIVRYQFNERSEKSFCSACGTVIFAINGKHFPEHKLVSLGTIRDYDDSLKPQIEVYTESKALCLE